MVDEEGDGPLEDGGGGLHAGSEDVSHRHEDVVVTEAHPLCARRHRTVLLGVALGPQQRVQQVSLHVVTVVCLAGEQAHTHTRAFPQTHEGGGARETRSLKNKSNSNTEYNTEFALCLSFIMPYKKERH